MPLAAAVRMADLFVETVPAATVKLPDELADMFTEWGTVRTALLLERVTIVPAAGAI